MPETLAPANRYTFVARDVAMWTDAVNAILKRGDWLTCVVGSLLVLAVAVVMVLLSSMLVVAYMLMSLTVTCP